MIAQKRHLLNRATSVAKHVVRSIPVRSFSDVLGGSDLLGGSLQSGDKPKVILDGYSSSGFDVVNVIEKIDEEEESESGAVHMCESIVVFPHACFLWKIKSIQDVTVESLSPALLHRPKLEYLFIGSEKPMDPQALRNIKTEMRSMADNDIVVEHLDLTNAMGTFNILNGEDRPVAAFLILDQHQGDENR